MASLSQLYLPREKIQRNHAQLPIYGYSKVRTGISNYVVSSRGSFSISDIEPKHNESNHRTRWRDCRGTLAFFKPCFVFYRAHASNCGNRFNHKIIKYK